MNQDFFCEMQLPDAFCNSANQSVVVKFEESPPKPIQHQQAAVARPSLNKLNRASRSGEAPNQQTKEKQSYEK